MNKGLSIALLVVGIILMIWGVSASDSFSSGLSRAVTGSPTNKAMGLLVSGIIATVVGVFGVLRGRK